MVTVTFPNQFKCSGHHSFTFIEYIEINVINAPALPNFVAIYINICIYIYIFIRLAQLNLTGIKLVHDKTLL